LERSYQPHGWLLVLDGEPNLFSHCLDRILHDASILNVMARSRRDSGSSRFWLVDDLWFILFEKTILASQPIVGIGWKTPLAPYHYSSDHYIVISRHIYNREKQGPHYSLEFPNQEPSPAPNFQSLLNTIN
jgi:hypothetical protein